MKFKFKKAFIALPVATMGAGLMATVLTSCGSGTIDDDKKVTLDSDGKLTDTYGYKDAIKMALTRSSSWATFKQALADEIIYKWYTDRMYQDKDGHKGKNKTFSSNVDQWKYQINKDYDSLVQSQKTKYGNNYKFYLQNEYLSQYGGTEETYKHAKLVEKVKAEFIANVFKFNYFSYNKETSPTSLSTENPQVFAQNATTTISREELNKPTSWSKLGFFASANPTYSYKNWPTAETGIDQDFLNFLSKNPDGDYAVIQNYVFNRFFQTEKPFYSSASLFKYSKPKAIEGDEKLSAIYNTSATEVKLPDNPDESFPFFGGAKITDESKGTRLFMEWYKAFDKGEFASPFSDASGNHLSNGTVSIPNEGTDKYSEDTQTLLLCSASQMIGGSESLYIPYSTVAAQMYANMMLTPEDQAKVANPKMNKSTKEYLATTIPDDPFVAIENNPAIFKNFFFDPTQYEIFVGTSGDALNSFIDLSVIYPEGIVKGTGTETDPYEYHCPLFKKTSQYTYLYGNPDSTSTAKTQINGKWFLNKSGIVLISNTMYINSLTPTTSGINGQPWALQLNTSGMHAQTIDGYDFVTNSSTYLSGETINKSEALKRVFKYRLMQQRTGQIKFISGDLLGSSGKLKTYFTNNFATIVLEMALSSDKSLNIFKEINKFKEAPADNTFFKTLCDEQKFVSTELTAYINETKKYDDKKKAIDGIDTANKAIYEYRSKQVTNAKSTSRMKTIYGNGLLAPLPIQYTPTSNLTRYNYIPCNYIHYLSLDGGVTLNPTPTKADLGTIMNAIKELDFVKHIDNVTKDTKDNAFSPQIVSAKNVMSNRYWYASPIVDTVMYAFNSSKDGLSNLIKYDTYAKYETDKIAADAGLKDVWSDMQKTDAFKQAITSTFKKSKTITGNITYADLDPQANKSFFTAVDDWYKKNYDDKIAMAGVNGEHSTDEALAEKLFYTTLVYLSINNFENLYKALNSKIGENEVAFVGYLNKFNPWLTDSTTEEAGKTDKQGIFNRYGWNANVENIYDQDGYLGNDPTYTSGQHTHSNDASSTYWNVVNKVFDGSNAHNLAGFTGIQSKTSNVLDTTSGLQDAVFNNFKLATLNSKNISTDIEYNSNDGAWFAFSGNKESDGKTEITFADVSYTDPITKETKTIKASQFQGKDGDAGTKTTKQVLRLAKKIANYDSIDDLKTLSKALADSYDGGSIFRMIAYNEKFYQDTNEMRYDMLSALPHFSLNPDGSLGSYVKGDFENCFKRVENVEVHTTTKVSANKNYSFNDKKGNGYHLFLTQINKADITEKRLTPKFEDGKFAQGNSPITPEEFLYILCATALESSTQSLAITQAIKLKYGDDKLKVYDANLYNTFDSTWIKDWVKKPIGK